MLRTRTRLFCISLAACGVLIAAAPASARQLPVPVVCPAPPQPPLPAPKDPTPSEGIVELKIREEIAPPGGLAQMKVYITEPVPITTGSGRFSFDDFESIEGISLSTASEDGYGIALFSGAGRRFALSFVSPSGTFGTDSDYPILTIVARVPQGLRNRSRLQAQIEPEGLRFIDPSGAAYPIDVESGILTVEPASVAVHDVQPGSADLAAGSVVTILGSNFRRDTRIRFGDVILSNVRLISPERIDVTLAGPVTMHGMRIRAENKEKPNRSKLTYFSYHRTTRDEGSSADAILSRVVPVFPRITVPAAVLDVAAGTLGVAIQNIEAVASASVTIDVLDAAGVAIQPPFTTTLGASRFTVLSLTEMFGAAAQPGTTIRVSSSTAPIQVMGVTWDGTNANPQIAR
jgi:hypothetical protein